MKGQTRNKSDFVTKFVGIKNICRNIKISLKFPVKCFFHWSFDNEKTTLTEEVELYVVYAKGVFMHHVFKDINACN